MMENENRLSHWGLSMYGGYYVELWAADGSPRWDGYHFNTYRQMTAWAKENGITLEKWRRSDNI